LKKNGVEIVGEKDIYVKVENERKNISGEIVGTQTQHIPGKRTKYRQHYICKKCGSECFSEYTSDSASLQYIS